MVEKRVAELARDLAAGYPGEEPERAQRDFLKVLEVVLPELTRKALAARQEGKTSVEEVWKAIRRGAEEDFRPALAHGERLKVIYVASKFMNNRAVGLAITEAALALAGNEEETDG